MSRLSRLNTAPRSTSVRDVVASATTPTDPSTAGAVWLASTDAIETLDPTNRLPGVNQKLRKPGYYAPYVQCTVSTSNLDAFTHALYQRLNLGLFLWPDTSSVVDTFSAEVTTVGATGAVIRFGIYPLNFDTGLPGPLLVDMGTISANASPADVAVHTIASLNVNMQRGWYFLAWCWQGSGAGTTGPTIRSRTVNTANQFLMPSSTTLQLTLQAPTCYVSSTPSGALPTDLSADAGLLANTVDFPSVMFHVAS